MENIQEIWKDIPNYEGLYQASSLGRIKGLKSNKILKHGKRNNGYLAVAICKDGIPKQKLVHRLVALTFLIYDDKYQLVDHIDGVRHNNVLYNLRFCNKYQNATFSNVKRRYNKKSKYIGVTQELGRNKWRVRFRVEGKLKDFGTYNTEIEASNVAALNYELVYP